MWIFLGIVSFIMFFCYVIWRKLNRAMGWTDNKGYLRTTSNQQYKFNDSTDKGSRLSLD